MKSEYRALLEAVGLHGVKCFKPLRLRNGQGYVPCGKCDACLYIRQQKLSGELTLEVEACGGANFGTLTFDDENLPADAVDWRTKGRLFRKALRRVWLKYGASSVPRIFMVAELGDKNGRPHFHFLMFGPDHAYMEYVLREAWRYGFVQCSPVMGGGAAYVSKYAVKMNGFTPAQIEALKRWGPIPRPFYPRRPGIGIRVAEGVIDSLKRSPHGLKRFRELGYPGIVRSGKHYVPLRRVTRDRIRDALYLDRELEREAGELEREIAHSDALVLLGKPYAKGQAVVDVGKVLAKLRRSRIGREGKLR